MEGANNTMVIPRQEPEELVVGGEAGGKSVNPWSGGSYRFHILKSETQSKSEENGKKKRRKHRSLFHENA